MHTQKNEADWQAKARNLLKAEIAKSGLKYEDVIGKLADIGVEETYKSFTGKMRRGSFQFTFALQVLEAIGVSAFRI